MKYSEEEALRLAAQHHLKPSTVNHWRERDNIPDRYTRTQSPNPDRHRTRLAAVFDEKLARAIVDQHGLPVAETLKRWRYQGQIPVRYLAEHLQRHLLPHDKVIVYNALRVLNNPKLHPLNFCQEIGTPYQRIDAARRGVSDLPLEDAHRILFRIMALHSEIKTLARLLALEEPAPALFQYVRTLLGGGLLTVRQLMDTPNESFNKRIRNYASGQLRQGITAAELHRVMDRLSAFARETSIELTAAWNYTTHVQRVLGKRTAPGRTDAPTNE